LIGPAPLTRICLPVAALAAACTLASCGGHGKHADAAATAPVSTQRSEASILAGSGEVPGEAPPPELVPLPTRAFRTPVARYRVYAAGRLDLMAADIARLRSALAAGSRPQAEAAWGDAYSHYLEVGAAYGAFGKLDKAVDATPARLPRGVHDRGFTGLHNIERGLWTGESLSALEPRAALLARDVAHLRRVVPKIEIDPLDYATRAHEILEDAQMEQMTGDAARWSGQGVRGTAAAFQGTLAVVGTLRRPLAGRGSTLEPIDTGVARLRAALNQVRRAHGGAWPSLAALRPRERELLDGRLGGLLEALSAVPGALETTNPPPIPELPK
jgi:high-affinity iron transporter